jgi:hypothetical protein
MPRFNGDIRLDGNLIFPSGAENTTAIRAFLNESVTGQPASGQIRFLRVGNEEGYWYLCNNPAADIYDFDATTMPSGKRIATLEDITNIDTGVSEVNGQVGVVTIRGVSGVVATVNDSGFVDIHASGITLEAGNGVIVSEEFNLDDNGLARIFRVSANQTHLEGEFSDGSFASGLVRLTSPSGSIQARTVGGQVQLDVDIDVINSGLQQPDRFTLGFTDETTVNVVHNFGNSGVMAVIYDDAARVIQPDEVTLIDTNTLEVTFNTAQTGTVVVLR